MGNYHSSSEKSSKILNYFLFSNCSNQAITGGYDVSGENLYIGRTNHQGDIIPGKVVQSHGVCYVPYGGEEHGKTTYQVLVHDANSGTDFVWVKAENGAVPTGAIQGGVGSDGERFFIGRVRHEGALCIGKVHPSHRTCYIAFGGKEHGYPSYETLCVQHIPLEH